MLDIKYIRYQILEIRHYMSDIRSDSMILLIKYLSKVEEALYVAQSDPVRFEWRGLWAAFLRPIPVGKLH